jgi:hypothetical protein
MTRIAPLEVGSQGRPATGLIIWPRIDDQRQRSLVTGRPGAAFTARQLVTEVIGLAGPAMGIPRRPGVHRHDLG